MRLGICKVISEETAGAYAYAARENGLQVHSAHLRNLWKFTDELGAPIEGSMSKKWRIVFKGVSRTRIGQFSIVLTDNAM